MDNQNNGVVPNNNDNSRFMPGNAGVNTNVNNNVSQVNSVPNQVNPQMAQPVMQQPMGQPIQQPVMQQPMQQQVGQPMGGFPVNDGMVQNQNNGGNKKVLFLIIGILVLLLLVGGAVTAVVVLNNKDDNVTSEKKDKEEKKDDEGNGKDDGPVNPSQPTTPIEPLPESIEVVSERKIGEKVVIEFKNVSETDLTVDVKTYFYDASGKELDDDDAYTFIGAGQTAYTVFEIFDKYEKYAYSVQAEDVSTIDESIDVSKLKIDVTKEGYTLHAEVTNTLDVNIGDVNLCAIWSDQNKEIDIRCSSAYSVKPNESSTVNLYSFNIDPEDENITYRVFANTGYKYKY